jgi:opacity protein-like surface antigen
MMVSVPVKHACLLLLLTMAAAGAEAQSVSFGVRAGLPLRGLLAVAQPGYRAATGHYTFGPTVEIRLPHQVAFETDLLYKHFDYQSPASSASASRWELPLLLKYGIQRRKLRPFASLGVGFSRVTSAAALGAPWTGIIQLRHRTTKGIVAAAGVEACLAALRIAPEIRITRWGDRNFGVSDAPLHSNLTQAELLIGFRF